MYRLVKYLKFESRFFLPEETSVVLTIIFYLALRKMKPYMSRTVKECLNNLATMNKVGILHVNMMEVEE